jgi:hypothetical protein
MCSRFTLTFADCRKKKEERKKEKSSIIRYKNFPFCHIETRALDETRSKAEADAMGN